MNLSEHFTLEELTFSVTALRHGIDNTPNALEVACLTALCTDILEHVRYMLACPLHIDSGYRSAHVNRLVGSTAVHSAHLDGNAADFFPVGMDLKSAFDKIRKSAIKFDQLIIECGAWIHISRAAEGEQERGEALIASRGEFGDWVYQNA